MEFGKRHDTTDGTLPTCYGFVVDLLWGSYEETDVMDFGKTCYEEIANLLRTCYGEVANLLWTCYRETDVMDFSLCGSNS